MRTWLLKNYCETKLIRILNYTKYEMLNKALQAFGDLVEDEELGPAEWQTVKKYISCLNGVDGELVHPHSLSENDDNLTSFNLKDIRIRFLNGVQAAYWVMLDEGRFTQSTANLLMQSVDEAIDKVSDEALSDWKGLKSYVNMPNYSKFLQSGIVPKKIVTFFIRAHRIARQQLHDFIGNSEIAVIVNRESEEEGVEAKTFLEDVRSTFPHSDLKKLFRSPPLVKIPEMRDLITANPLLGVLPSTIRKTLVGSTKEILKPRGASLYKEGSKATGIWLISNGIVKCSSKKVSHKTLLNQTFTHGSTLGLYEVLAGKPYI